MYLFEVKIKELVFSFGFRLPKIDIDKEYYNLE